MIVTSEEESQHSLEESFVKKRRGRPSKRHRDSEDAGYSDEELDPSEDSIGESDDFIDDEDVDQGLRRSNRYRNNTSRIQNRKSRNRRKCTDSYGNTKFGYISGNEGYNQTRRNHSYDYKDSHLGKRSQLYYNDFDESCDNQNNYTTRARTRLRHDDNIVATKQLHDQIEDSAFENNLPPTTCYRCALDGAKRYCENYDQCKRAFHDGCSEVRGSWNLRSKVWYCFECSAKMIYIKEKEKIFTSQDNKWVFDNQICERMWCDITEFDLDGLIPQVGDKFYFIPQAYEYFVARFFEMLNYVDDPFESAQKKQIKESKIKEGLQSMFATGTRNLRRKANTNELNQEDQNDEDAKQEKEKEKLENIKVWPFENNFDLIQNER